MSLYYYFYNKIDKIFLIFLQTSFRFKIFYGEVFNVSADSRCKLQFQGILNQFIAGCLISVKHTTSIIFSLHDQEFVKHRKCFIVVLHKVTFGV